MSIELNLGSGNPSMKWHISREKIPTQAVGGLVDFNELTGVDVSERKKFHQPRLTLPTSERLDPFFTNNSVTDEFDEEQKEYIDGLNDEIDRLSLELKQLHATFEHYLGKDDILFKENTYLRRVIARLVKNQSKEPKDKTET